MSKLEDVVRSKMTAGDVVLIVFIILKLTGNIDWSWWWVLCPLWGVFAAVVTVGLLAKLVVED